MTHAIDDTVRRPDSPPTPEPGRLSRLWRRQLETYPADGPRTVYLGIVVLATIVLYYELYIQGAVATQIIQQYSMSLRYFILIAIVGGAVGAVGAVGSVMAGLADRWGRANLVVLGLLATALLVLFALPGADSKTSYLVAFALLSLVEGALLVATPALIRDFSPQLGRASAMGFWTLGPVIGSLAVTGISSHTLPSHPDWRFQFQLCGVIGLVAFAVALVGLRELSPRLRDQLMVSRRDLAVIQARAAGIDPQQALKGHWRQMLRRDVIGPAFAISVFLLFYFFAVGFFVIYFAVAFGYSEARANSLANWYWISNAIALLVVGAWSDRLRVRKPFMVVGALVSASGVAAFAALATHPRTSYHTFAWLLVVIAAGSGVAYCTWMAAFTETVERHNPAASATGLAVWGGILRTTVTLSMIGLIFAIPSAGVLVDHGPELQRLSSKYQHQLAPLSKLSPETRDALSRDPQNSAYQITAVSELTGLTMWQVTQIYTLTTTKATEIATLQAVDPATLTTLAANPADGAALTSAIAQVRREFGVDDGDALERLLAASALKPTELEALQTNGPVMQQAAERLQALGDIPAADAAFLAAHGEEAQQAQRDAPREWQRWWWIAFAGQITFLPFIGLLTGRWRPRKARRDAAEHEARIERELAKLTQKD
jgi:ACS family D-galactonate transporter-like MFS transporter